jgi:putrescine aminotransferase
VDPLRTDAAWPRPSYGDWKAAEAAFAAHVHPGRVALLHDLGVQLEVGAREGGRFQNAVTGQWLWNCHSNGGVFNLGHRNPRVVAALRGALDELDVGNHHLVSAYRAMAAERLSATTEGRLPGVVFAASGSEAVEIALKAARGFTQRRGIVSVVGGFHGHTGLAIAAGDEATRTRYLLDFDDFSHVPYNDLDAMRAAVSERTAAVLLEPVPATLGFPPPDPGYLAGIEEVCRQQGALLILDEVQTGLGRTGTAWYHQQEGITPHALVTSKGLGGGVYPVGATLLDAEVFAWFTGEFASHVSSFGGSELGCVVATTVCDMLTEPGFLDHVRALAQRFTEGFAGAPFALRQRGLVMGLDMGEHDAAYGAWRALFGAGVFAFPAAFDTAVLQFKPPLILSLDDADEIIRIVRTALG